MTDESKYESTKAFIAFAACVAIIVGFPWWGPIVAKMIGPEMVVVMERGR